MVEAQQPSTTRELCELYLEFADEYYRHPADQAGHREPTGELVNLRDALRWLLEEHASTMASQVDADVLLSIQRRMVRHRKSSGKALSREYVNATIKRIRRMFRWAARPGRRWCTADQVCKLDLVEQLRPGRSAARETPPVTPVAEALYTDALAALASEGMQEGNTLRSRALSLMLETQWLTGMRPGEVCRMRREEIALESAGILGGTEQIMVYCPSLHKTRHHGIDRNIFFGPEARRLIEDWLSVRPSGRLFWYTTNSYGAALAKLLKRHGLPHFAPNQIRHAFATRMRDRTGLDVVQVLMGHRHRSTTEIYAQPDAAAAISAIIRHG